MHTKGEENKQGAKCQSQIQPTRRQEIQPPPPSEMPFLNPVLEYEAHDTPGEVIQGCGRWDCACAAEYQWRHDVLERRFRVAFEAKVDDDGHNGAKDEEEEESRVDASRREHAVWADEAPDDGG